MPLQIRRGTEAQRQAMTVPLAVGEPLFVTDTGSIWVGDGVSPGGVQVTGLTLEDTVDAVAAALVAGINQNITFVYGTTQDQANRIDARLDLSSVEGTIDADGFKGPLLADDSGVIVNSSNRNITANEISATDISANNLLLSGTLTTPSIVSDFKGSLFGDDSTIIFDAVQSSINLNQTIKSNVIPGFDDLIDLGSTGAKFASLHLGAEGLYIDGAQIQGTFFGSIDLPEGSTVNGQPISVLGNLTGDINANIIGDDSGVIVNVSTGIITGDIIGNVRGDIVGSVFADDSTLLVDAVSSTLSNGRIKLEDNSFTLSLDLSFDRFVFQGDTGALDDFLIIGQNITLRGTTVGTPGDANFLVLQCSGGDVDTPTVPSAGDSLGGIGMAVWDGVDYDSNAFMINEIDTVTGINPLPGKIKFYAKDFSGSSFATASLNSRGVFESSIFYATPFADATARDTQVGTATPGMIVYNTALSKFQGYVHDSDGLGNPGWVDLN